jgi:hypothetical protein
MGPVFSRRDDRRPHVLLLGPDEMPMTTRPVVDTVGRQPQLALISAVNVSARAASP